MDMKSIRFMFTGLIALSLVLSGCSRQGEQAGNADQLSREISAAFASHDIEKILSLYTDDVVYEDVVVGKTNHGKDELRAFMKDFIGGAPDIKMELKSIIVSGDRFCMEGVFSGTQTGNWADYPATGKSFSIRGVSVGELRDGKIKHNTDYYDGASLMQQLGVLPQMAAADPFVGTWKLNVAKSKATDPSALPKSEISKWEGLDNGMKAAVNGVDAAGNAYQIEISAKYDGKDYALKGYPLADTLAQKKIDATTLEMIAKKAGQEVERWQITISKDGKTQTWVGKGKNAKGKEFNGTFAYDRQ